MRNMRKAWISLVLVALAVPLLVGSISTSHAQAPVTLNGAGATFPYPLYSKWSQVYAAEKGVRINYQSIGSGGGIRQFIAKTVDFGASDGPMTDEQIRQAGGRVLHIPMVAGAVVPVYNIPGVGSGLNFTGDVLADIFLGKITKWNDPRLAKLNPNVKLPSADIVVVHRSDGSGTTAIWANYLSKVSAEWKSKVGEGTSVNWPTGLGGKGNEGVAGLVRQTPNSLGYVELAYAVTNKMTFGKVRNKAGQFIQASLSTTTRAMEGALKAIPEDYRIFITDPEGRDVYPIAGFTWILIYGEQPDPVKGKALVEFLWWATHDGQKYAPPLLYAPLSKGLVQRIEKTLKTVTSRGEPLLP
ncbi:MAG: phosphate ABC transporter substrate-binding protein PstS [Armatimonadota bacterium]|nr:phosphate ABC transporter substrate-binding protein PstS [Armatimonadota bacterium]MDR5702640.1 phosphate ABC transporter substrate-binding protein PstS [Armatimonadota bacterium]